jgi:hypothetical protein
VFAVPRSIPMSLDNQPKSPLNMNYLLAALSSPKEARSPV